MAKCLFRFCDLNDTMKTPREILLEVCPQIQKNAKQWDAYTGYNKELEKIVIEAMERYTEQKLNKHGVSGKRLTEIIHKAVDETYQTVDSYVNEYVDSTYAEMMQELNSLKDELSAACASGAVDTVAERGSCPYANHDLHLKLFGYCNACETQIARKSSEGQP